MQEEIYLKETGVEITSSHIILGDETIRSEDFNWSDSILTGKRTVSNAWFESQHFYKNKWIFPSLVAAVLLLLMNVDYKLLVILIGVLLFCLAKEIHCIKIVILPHVTVTWKTEDKQLHRKVKSALRKFGLSETGG